MKLELSLVNLKQLDMGKIDAAFTRALRRVAEDCADRPVDDRPRKVSLAVDVVPSVGDSGDCDGVDISCQITSRIPSQRSRVYQCRLARDRHGMAVTFDGDNPEARVQPTFDELTSEQTEEKDKE